MEAQAEAEIKDPPSLHYPILKFEKNENPQNILIVYTLLDEKCNLQPNPENRKSPVLDFYWLMDGNKYKRTHPLIKYNIRQKLQIDPKFKLGSQGHSFPVLLNELGEINPAFHDARLIVESAAANDKCEVRAHLESSDKEWQDVTIEKIYTESKKTFLPPFRKVLSIRIDGKNSKTGSAVSKTYLAK